MKRIFGLIIEILSVIVSIMLTFSFGGAAIALHLLTGNWLFELLWIATIVAAPLLTIAVYFEFLIISIEKD